MEIARSEVNRLRALITECLPFELPFEASTHWLYDWLETRATLVSSKQIKLRVECRRDLFLLALIDGDSAQLPVYASADSPRAAKIESARISTAWRAPATFTVRRDQLRTRNLDFLALASQVAIAYIYAKHKDSLLYYGSRVNTSLRYPTRVNSHGKYLRAGPQPALPEQSRYVETPGRRLNTYNSFFAYEKYAFIGQFYDSPRWHAVEARWTFLRRIDVSNCFSSVYTHSFAWSTGTDLHSKSHLGATPDFHTLDLGRAFDKVMQSSNWGETHGICVGPEASRLFAEVIFQKIDLEIQDRLRLAQVSHKDYEFLRYVDDYFLYSRDLSCLEKVTGVVTAVLSEYGYALNATKTRDYVTPFTTSISMKKATLKSFLKQSLPKKGALPKFDTREIGVHLKSLLIDSDNDAAAVGSSLSLVERELKKFIKKRSRKCTDLTQARKLSQYSWGFVHGMLHQYLSHPSVNSAMKIVRTLRYFWNSVDNYQGLSDADRRHLRYGATETLHFATTKAITRLIDADGSEIEICHFLSLASACDLELASSEEIAKSLLGKLEMALANVRTAKSNQAFLFLLLSALKYFLHKGQISGGTRNEFLELSDRVATKLMGLEFLPSGSVSSHASQEYFALAILECGLMSEDERFKILAKPWLLSRLESKIAFPSGEREKYAQKFLRRCIAAPSKGNAVIGAFEWGAVDFDGLLYEKEPQFIY